MKEVLVLGNSQTRPLRRSYEIRVDEIRAAQVRLSFYVIPGGMGPDFTITETGVAHGRFNPKYPPYMVPPGLHSKPLADFDAIVISALGFVDGGYAFKNQIPMSGAVHEFGPRGPARQVPLVSDRCFWDMVQDGLDLHPGMQTLRALCKAYRGPVYVQPFPDISDAMLTHEGWGLRRWYHDPLGMHLMLTQARDAYLSDLAKETGARLLPRAVDTTEQRMTPQAWMRKSDGVHMSATHGSLVLDQIVAEVTAP